jgi:hypothetical protein
MNKSAFPPVAAAQCWTTSNVHVVSNVFPINDVYVNRRDMPGRSMVLDGIYKDKNFRLQVRGKEAVRQLALQEVNGGNDEGHLREALIRHGEWQDTQGEVRWLEDWQINLYLTADGGGRCAECPTGARPIGMGWSAAISRIENRCDITKCRCRLPVASHPSS